MQNQNTAPAATQAQAAKPTVTQQQQQQQQTAQAQQQALQANFAQILAQQAGLLQQQQQAQQAQAQQAQAQRQVSQQGQQQQQQPQIQFPFAADPNLLLQQLQFAQLQQQIQAAQAQQQATNTQIPNAAAVQQQLQAHFAQAQAAASAAANATPKPAAAAAVAPPKPPPKKKAPPKSMAKAPPVASASSAVGTVSASDTDGEMHLAPEVLSSNPAKKMKLDPIDMSNMTPSQKAKANRDRNREHARNTRLRKKAYLEKLKMTVDELCRERETLVSERATAANLLVEMHNTRTEVLMSFFALRSSNEKRRKLWSSIMDECCFTCVMPVTPYRSFPASEVQLSKCLRTIMGIDGMMADTASLHVLFDTLVDRNSNPYGKIEFRYTLVTEDTVVAGNQMMARWTMTTTNAIACGAKMEVAKQGMLCCKFNSAHKITRVEIMFDVMAFMLQLKQAAGSDGFSVVPNTVQTCQRSFDKPMVLSLVEPPYTIIQVNKLWEEMTGYTADEVVGKMSCKILQCDGTDGENLETLMQEIRYKRAASSVLVNKKKDNEIFTNFFVVFPLSTDSRITYYLGLTMHHQAGAALRPEGESQLAPPSRIQLQNMPIENGDTKMEAKNLSAMSR